MAVAISFRTAASASSSGTNSISFASQDIGAASSDRLVFVAVMNGDAADISGVDIAGSAGANSGAGSLTNTCPCAIYWRLVTSGTTGTITIHLAANGSTTARIAIWAVTGADTTSPISAVASDNKTTGTTMSNSVVVPSGGGLLVAGGMKSSRSTATCTPTNYTEDFDAGSGSSGNFSGGSGTSSGSISVTQTWSQTIVDGNLAMVAVAQASAGGPAFVPRIITLM